MRIRRADDNQAELVKQMRKIPGLTVAHTHTIGKGFPDLIIGWKGLNYLVEVKDGKKTTSRKRLTADEERFISTWTGSVHVAESLDDILKIIKP